MPYRHASCVLVMAVTIFSVIHGAAEPAAPAAPATAATWQKFIVRSAGTGKIERFWVGHSPALSKDGQYPVIYFLPGLLDDDDTWKKALDPHLAKAEVIAVCPAVGGGTWFMNSPAQPWMRWGDFLTQDLPAFIEARYPAARQKGQHGVTGISAGGHAAFYHAITRPDLYGSVSVLSGAMDLRGYAGAVGLDYWIGPRTPDALPLYAERSCLVLAQRQTGPLPFDLFLDAGTADGAMPQMESLRRALAAKGIDPRWYAGKGGHDWSYWTGRAEDHLKWHLENFARNRKEGRYAEIPATKPAELEVITQVPDVELSADALSRLKAAWTDAPAARTLPVSGIPPGGATLPAAGEAQGRAMLKAPLTAQGHRPGVFTYRLTAKVAAAGGRAGTVSLTHWILSGRGLWMMSLPAMEIALPAGGAETALRVRLVVELKEPDPVRGGIIAAAQRFDDAGQPVGQPLVGKARPGTADVERWPIAPQAQVTLVFALAGPGAATGATIKDVRLEAE